jgi:thiol-disulfide isomerase/thioredoxin
MKIINIIGVAILLIAVIACDVVEPPYKKDGNNVPIDTTKKKVLIEDFTGFRCGNCPEAAELAHTIAEQFPGQVIKIGLHAGPLSLPTPTRKYNFRVQESLELATYYGLVATPYGLVNRSELAGQTLLGPSAWGGLVASQLLLEAELKIFLNASYNETSKEISLEAQLDYLKAGNLNHYIAVYIVEDSIVQYQQDDRQFPNVHVLDFVHNNVLRGSFNGTWGVPVSDAPISAGSSITLPYKYKISEDKDWRPNKLSLVVFVHDNISKEILQVEQVYLSEK